MPLTRRQVLEHGKKIGLWYSVRNWRLKGSASVSENNQVAVTIPVIPSGRKKTSAFCKF